MSGIGFLRYHDNEPDVTIVKFMDSYKVCIRRTHEWKEAIAEFTHEEHAKAFFRYLTEPAERAEPAFDKSLLDF